MNIETSTQPFGPEQPMPAPPKPEAPALVQVMDGITFSAVMMVAFVLFTTIGTNVFGS